SVRGGGWLVELGRGFHSKGFMWPTVVEVRSPEVASSLLGLDRRCRKRLELERDVAVHALVPTIVGGHGLARGQVVDAEAGPPALVVGGPERVRLVGADVGLAGRRCRLAMHAPLHNEAAALEDAIHCPLGRDRLRTALLQRPNELPSTPARMGVANRDQVDDD